MATPCPSSDNSSSTDETSEDSRNSDEIARDPSSTSEEEQEEEAEDEEEDEDEEEEDGCQVVGVYCLSTKAMAELQRIVKASEKGKFDETELQQLISSLDSLRYTIGCNPVFPCTFVMQDVSEFQNSSHEKEWCSEPFYTWPRGYKMCLGVYANGRGKGKGTHLSVCLHRMWGEFDYYLKGPIGGSVTIQLVRDQNPTNKLAQCEAETVIEFVSRRRVTSSRMNMGWSNTSSDTFISFKKLADVIDIENNQLNFKVTQVVCIRL